MSAAAAARLRTGRRRRCSPGRRGWCWPAAFAGFEALRRGELFDVDAGLGPEAADPVPAPRTRQSPFRLPAAATAAAAACRTRGGISSSAKGGGGKKGGKDKDREDDGKSVPPAAGG